MALLYAFDASSELSDFSEDALMATNANITEALRRTIGTMQGELEKSVLTTQMLGQSSITL